MRKQLTTSIVLFCIFLSSFLSAQLPSNVLVGYHENWNTLKLSQINSNYNVICLAFALPVNAPSVGYDIRYTIPAGYTGTAAQMQAAFIADIDALHAAGKVVLLSIGGATGPVMLSTTAQRDVFVSSVNNILSTYSYKIDGIDLDLETSSMAFGSSWTMTSPAAGQTNMVNAVKSIMTNYQTQTGKKLLLTAAPEVVYLMGGLSTYQVSNLNGGAFLPILDGLRNDIDLLCMQLYNAGGSGGGVYAWNGTIYYDNGSPDFALAMNETVIKGFTCVSGKGSFTGIPANKLAFGFPATTAPTAAGTGYVTPTNVCNAAKYFKGAIAKPTGVTYTMSTFYPSLKGLMTWSINEDSYQSYPFVGAYTCAFSSSAPTANFSISSTSACTGQSLTFTNSSTGSPTSYSWNFGTDASIATATTVGPHSISYSTTGTKTITLTVSNTGGSNTISKTVTISGTSGNAGAITGNAAVCQTSSQSYSIAAVSNATNYTWTVPTGSAITSGQGSNAITVTIGGTAGNISVTPSNGCSSGTAATKAITINPAPSAAGSITGSSSVCAGAINVSYSIAAVSNATAYTWSVPSGATITGGQGTTGITVTFGSSAGNISVTPSNSCGNGSAATKAITINNTLGATGSISGNQTVCSGQSGLTYSIAAVSGASTYTWTVPSGASITSGQGSTSITMTTGSTTGNISVTPSNSCSSGTTSSITVSTTTGATLPLNEGFESAVPPASWSLSNADASNTWTSSTAYASGSKSAKMTFFGYANSGARDELKTMPLNFNGFSTVVLTFKHAYAWLNKSGTSKDKYDSLAIAVSTDCGSSWTQIWKKGGTQLSTLASGTGQSTAFTPTTSQWASNSISLAAYAGQGSVLVKFIACNRDGNNLYIDNINISGTMAPVPLNTIDIVADPLSIEIDEIKNENTLSVYPNPFRNGDQLYFTTEVAIDASITLVDMMGKDIYTFSQKAVFVKGQHVFEYPSNLPAGIYFVKLTTDNEVKSIQCIKLD
jgi:chitinase